MNEPSEDLGFELPQPVASSRGRVVVVLVALVAGAFAFGYFQHKKGHTEAAVEAGAPASTRVEIIVAKTLQSDQALVLPGVVKALEEAKIYPRISGYVRRWLVDFGDKVTAGQLLAEIDAPDVDAQLAQARAQLAQARASLLQATAQRDYSRANADRNATMASQQLIAQATLEQAVSQAKVDQANVIAGDANIAAMEANVHRLTEMTGFEKVTAPFAGKVTMRTVDRGNLVGDATVAAVAVPMFTIAAIDPVRVIFDVPQTVAPSVHIGDDVKVVVREYAGRVFAGKVTHTTGALDPDLHVMPAGSRVPNPDGALMPGMYVEVQLTLPVAHRVLEIPSTALYNDAQGMRVAIVDAHGKIHFSPITLERDTGATLWIATGLTGNEKVVKIAVPSLVEGDVVEIASSAALK